ncbi:hypothetical protein LOC71_18435 [Rhodopirellula sp. JC740]|uniref:Uncharacterized protein n=1 Tax=Rhodopirellula halodulae TaxID=2894198 RepID=A0ABS8NLJ9_9BACT|nr:MULTISPECIES: hypothetical protein [unclassified Rhodopirellula]MCC9644259.1 hypothetical protein [Rhodopirellula sp. JC740]MCC9657421.1 hypothetical protein [Rhodopirellula sp. JC737]
MNLSNLCKLLPLLLLPAVVGCGSSAPQKATDEQNAFAAIEGLGDIAGDPKMFATAFVDGSAPDNADEYAQRGYEVAGEGEVNGDQMTVPVKIFGGVFASSSSDRGKKASDAGNTTQTWTLQRVNEDWKIKDAPLG